jgi:hypothetical protein
MLKKKSSIGDGSIWVIYQDHLQPHGKQRLGWEVRRCGNITKELPVLEIAVRSARCLH